jgi:hypothetical protein
MSMKYALAAAMIWIALIWIGGLEEWGGSEFLFGWDDGETQFNTWVVGLGVIWGLYYLFRKKIDKEWRNRPGHIPGRPRAPI